MLTAHIWMLFLWGAIGSDAASGVCMFIACVFSTITINCRESVRCP